MMKTPYICPAVETFRILPDGILAASDSDPLKLPGTTFDNPIYI